MKKPLVIAVDVDGVLADLVGRLCQLLNEKAALDGRNYTRRAEDFKVYNLFASLDAEEQKAVHLWSRAMGMCTSIPWYPGASLFLRTLQDMGEVFAVTAPWKCPSWDSERRDWLSPAIPASHVISVSAEAKPFACAGADVLIEDRADTLAAWHHHAAPHARGILIDRPWNRDVTFDHFPAGRIVRVHTYGQAARAVLEASK